MSIRLFPLEGLVPYRVIIALFAGRKTAGVPSCKCSCLAGDPFHSRLDSGNSRRWFAPRVPGSSCLQVASSVFRAIAQDEGCGL